MEKTMLHGAITKVHLIVRIIKIIICIYHRNPDDLDHPILNQNQSSWNGDILESTLILISGL